MHKPQILWRHQTPTHASIKLGWNNLSMNSKLWLTLFYLLVLTFTLYRYSQTGSEFELISGILTSFSIPLFILQAKGFPKESLDSLMEILKVENGTIWIGDFQLPETVHKVVIGRTDIQGPAFLQLAWNQGHQWIFQLNELQQVRHFFREHAPQIEVVNE